jgi:hypothetical protein
MPVAAIAGGASLIGAGANIIAGNKAAKAQKKASDQQIAEWRRQYDQDRADLAPWRTVGGSAIQRLGGMYGLEGGTATAEPYGGFFASPDYNYRKDESLKALDRYQAARGMWNSGATRKRAEEVAGSMASSEYGNWWNRLAGLAGAGQAATNTTIAAGQNATSGIAGAQQNAGNARASSYLNTGSAINQGLNNVFAAYMYNRGMNNPFGGG